MNRLMMAVVEDLEDEAVEEDLAVMEALTMVIDRLLVTIVEL